MSKTSSIPLPAAHALRKLGRDLALGRRKRGISTRDMAARLFVSRDTLWRMERGDQFIGSSALTQACWPRRGTNSENFIASRILGISLGYDS